MFYDSLGQSRSTGFIFNLPDLVRVMEQFVARSYSFHFVRGSKSVLKLCSLWNIIRALFTAEYESSFLALPLKVLGVILCFQHAAEEC